MPEIMIRKYTKHILKLSKEVSMVNKLARICILVLVLFIMPIIVSAGSIPEDLLHSDDAQIFFAEVVHYHPDKETPDIEVSPVEIIKGDVKFGGKLTYYNPNSVGNFKVKEGKIYLFTYFDENNPTDIFEVENNENYGINLVNVEGDMWKRFEKYLNDGEYFKAEQERRQKQGMPLLIDNPIAMGNLPYINNSSSDINFIIFAVPALVFVIAFVIGYSIKKKRS